MEKPIQIVIEDLRETLVKLAEVQQNLIKQGKATTEQIAEQKIIEAEVD